MSWFPLNVDCSQLKSNAFVYSAACDALAERKPFDNKDTFDVQFFRAAQAIVSIDFYRYIWNNEALLLCYELAARN